MGTHWVPNGYYPSHNSIFSLKTVCIVTPPPSSLCWVYCLLCLIRQMRKLHSFPMELWWSVTQLIEHWSAGYLELMKIIPRPGWHLHKTNSPTAFARESIVGGHSCIRHSFSTVRLCASDAHTLRGLQCQPPNVQTVYCANFAHNLYIFRGFLESHKFMGYIVSRQETKLFWLWKPAVYKYM